MFHSTAIKFNQLSGPNREGERSVCWREARSVASVGLPARSLGRSACGWLARS